MFKGKFYFALTLIFFRAMLFCESYVMEIVFDISACLESGVGSSSGLTLVFLSNDQKIVF